MDKNYIALSTNCLQLINNIDNLVFDLLYNSETGFTKLTSKEAVENSDKLIEKFNFEVQKLIENSKICISEEIVKEKREDLIRAAEEYTAREAVSWSEETFEEFINNSLFSAFLNKNNLEKIKKIQYQVIKAVDWISEIKNLSVEEKNNLLKSFENKFKQTISSDNEDYIPEAAPDKSDEKEFLKIRNDFIEMPYFKLDLLSLSNKLNKEDILYFTRLQNDFRCFKRFQARDEIMLVNSAIELLKLKSETEKYNFIKEVDGDITIFLLKNKKIEDSEKIEIIKTRMKLFCDSLNKNKTSEYYKKLLS